MSSTDSLGSQESSSVEYRFYKSDYDDEFMQAWAVIESTKSPRDLTLKCPGIVIKVHQSLMAASSYFMSRMLAINSPENQEQQKIVMHLPGWIQGEELKSVIDFIYKSDAIVPLERVERFISKSEMSISVNCN